MKTILEMAIEAGFLEHEGTLYTNHKFGDCFGELEAFAEIVRAGAIADENEACAKVCDEQHDRARTSTGASRADACAKAIRARRKT